MNVLFNKYKLTIQFVTKERLGKLYLYPSVTKRFEINVCNFDTTYSCKYNGIKIE